MGWLGSEPARAPAAFGAFVLEGDWDKLTKQRNVRDDLRTFLAQKKLHIKYNYSFWWIEGHTIR